MYEMFRILDNFNVPLGPEEAALGGKMTTKGMRSSTIWTSVYDLNNKIMYYHTQHDRRVRRVDIEAINFNRVKSVQAKPLDKEKSEDFLEVDPLKPW
jgi:choloylglycine hydrolase